MVEAPESSAPSAALFPAFLRLDGSRVLLVGGGEVALRKARLLLRAGARLTLVAPGLHPQLALLAARGALEHRAADFAPAQLDGCRLAVAAADDPSVNRAVAAAAEGRGIFVNVVDDAEASSFVTPALVERTPLTVAIGTQGAAPVLARRLRERIEAWLPAGYGRLAGFMATHRGRVKASLPLPARRSLWERFLDSPGAEAALRGDAAGAERALEALLAGAPPGGEVYLVGAGPGDPDLLTLRALQLMQQADVVLYDRLIGDGILERVRRDAERVFVGKDRHRHTLPQAEINAELVRRAKAGQRVLRLKGGDPFIFGRGGEEIETLIAHRIAFQVVPGITAASGCAAYAGIPLTHRDHAQTCVFVTGHPRADGRLELPWPQLVQPRQTLAIYMGLGALPALCAALIEHGLAPAHPAALIDQGTRAAQRVVIADLQTLPARVAAAGVSGPSLVIVGSVVTLRDRLKWFENR
ncbi:MAG: uroporphyrinogen-III C-methyltransferase [Gammaproteobacteria bacterium]|nr:uroporphyrinogen-III C-methyltransferase [Gammaproteobacteria bacterium]